MDASVAVSKLIQILSCDSESFMDEIDDLKRRKDQISHDVIRMGVLGVTSAGKSTLINSLLGEKLLPSEAKPSSSRLVSCKKGEVREAKIYFNDNKIKIFRKNELTPKIISKYGNEQENQGNKELVSQIEIISPNLSLPANIELVDSPGLDAYGLEGHERITMESMLPHVDFCIFVTTCKTNSDKKMLSVLNAIARYDKPVIIVQNMIDSLRGTPDGRKTIKEVADEHVVRIKRVVNQSDIKDKTSVHILQMSAIWALACRIVLLSNKKLTIEGKDHWEKSGFNVFVDLLRTLPSVLSSKINNSNLVSIENTIERIKSQIDIADDNRLPYDDTDYRSLYNIILRKVDNALIQITSTIDSYLTGIKQLSFIDQTKITSIKIEHSKWTDTIANIIRTYNEDIISFCKKLNISIRDIRNTFIPSQAGSLRVYKKIISTKRKQKGIGGWFKRTISFGNWGYETVTEEVEDWYATRENVISFLQRVKSDYSNQLRQWYDNIVKSNSYIEQAISTKERQNVAAQKRKLETDKKREIIKRLIELKAAVHAGIKETKIYGTDHHMNVRMIQKNIYPMTYFSYITSKNIIKRVHKKTFDLLIDNRNIRIYSWDNESLNTFCTEFVGIPANDMKQSHKGVFINRLNNPYASIPSVHPKGELAIIFVNLTQPGAAKKQILNLMNACKNLLSAEIIFIIQDLQEVITGGDLKSALSDMNGFFKSKLPQDKFHWFAIHRNPLYNIALWEIQGRNIRNQNEEILIANELKKRLKAYYQSGSEKIIADFTRSLC